MKHLLEFRKRQPALALSRVIHQTSERIGLDHKLQIMEVCGGHTIAIFKYGLKTLLPSNVETISGPGCPVCVTHNDFIDYAVALSRLPDVTITTFGDLIRVPGSLSSLANEKANGAKIRVCYSPSDALEFARQNLNLKVVFLGIGFETTAPLIASVIKTAKRDNLKNFMVLSAIKTMPNALRALNASGDIRLNGLICPGHVSTITGDQIYQFLADEFKIPCVVSGFEPIDLLQSIYMILRQIEDGRHSVENQYSRSASHYGNPVALKLLSEVFEPCDVSWRGLGVIPGSGLSIRKEFEEFDARVRIPLEIAPVRENKACICGAIMRGTKKPLDCPLFAKTCNPEDPKGACMVSDEGSCATYYKYLRL